MMDYIDNEKLISLVYSNECIYNKHHSAYKSHYLKDAAWTSISKDLNVNEDLCRRRWVNLRDRYTREIRKMGELSVCDGESCSGWPLLDKLNFLKVHQAPSRRPRQSRSINVYTDPFADASPQIPIEFKSCTTWPADFFSSSQGLEATSAELEKCKNSPPSTENSSRKKKRQLLTMEEEFMEPTDVFKTVCRSRETGKINEAVNGFGQMICAVISDMSEQKQIRTMLLVTELVMKIKLESEGDYK